MESIANRFVATLIEKGLTVATAESCTGGLVSAKITSVSGSSAVISFSMVTYSNQVKIEKLGVDKSTVDSFGAVSEQTAREMADRIKHLAGSDIGIGITGVAGPSQSEGKPVGLVFVAIAFKEKTTVEKLNFGNLTREQIREKAAEKALELALKGVTDATK